MSSSSKSVDLGALKFNQISIIMFTIIGFILNQPIITAIVSFILVAGSITSHAAVFKLTYRYVIRPLGIIQSDISEGSPAPHIFAQLVGGLVLAAGSALIFLGETVVGWIFAWVVILLATVNLVFGFCAGCFLYFQLGRFGVPGFLPKELQTSDR